MKNIQLTVSAHVETDINRLIYILGVTKEEWILAQFYRWATYQLDNPNNTDMKWYLGQPQFRDYLKFDILDCKTIHLEMPKEMWELFNDVASKINSSVEDLCIIHLRMAINESQAAYRAGVYEESEKFKKNFEPYDNWFGSDEVKKTIRSLPSEDYIAARWIAYFLEITDEQLLRKLAPSDVRFRFEVCKALLWHERNDFKLFLEDDRRQFQNHQIL